MGVIELGRRAPAQLRFRVGRCLLHSRVIAPEYMRLRSGYRGYRLTSKASLVVDGFPRSANTYVWYALRSALEPEYEVRGHTHSPATLLGAVRLEIPAMLLLRAPDDAVASYVQLEPAATISSAFRAYVTFHRPLLQNISAMHVATFNSVVASLPTEIFRLNCKFGTTFPLYRPTPENEAEVEAQIESATRRRYGGQLNEAAVPRPSASRRPTAVVLSHLRPKERRWRERANAIYEALVRREALTQGLS